MEHKSNNIIKNDKIATSVVEFQAQEILPKIILTIGADMPFKIFLLQGITEGLAGSTCLT